MRSTILIGIRAGNRCLKGCALAALITCGGFVCAAGVEAPTRYAIHQPAQPLADSLRAVARQTGASLVFDPKAVQGLTSGSISGQFSAAEAIGKLLQGTGLVLSVQPDGAMVVRPAPSPSRGIASQPVASSEALPPATRQGEPGTVARVASAAVLARTDGGALSDASADIRGGQKIEITGSRLRRIDGDTALPVNTYSREDIARSGQPSLERFLSSLNEASMSPGEGNFGTLSGQASVQLRGLPVGSTLVLVNGRRVQAVGSSTGNIFNLNLIPLAAVERIEIVPVGSSAVYGGDALAGVVNIILKSSLDGLALDARVAAGRGFGDGSISLAGGGGDERGGFVLLGSYSKATPLNAADRAFFVDGDYRRFDGRDARTRNCTPGTVTSASGANLPGLNSSFAGIPNVASGQALTAASFSATAGLANLCGSLANGNGSALIYGDEQFGLHGSAHYQLGQGISAFGELTLAKDKLNAKEAGLLLSNVLVPASNPYNPFGVPVRVTARLGSENGTEGIERRTDFTRLLLGVRGEFASRWDYEASVSTTRDTGDRQLLNGTVNATARTAALAASTTSAALNPFTSGLAASDDVLRGIWTDTARQNDGRKDQVTAFVRGPVMQLPAGSVDAIAGVEWARDRYKAVVPGTVATNSRSSEAAYGELRVPLMRSGEGGKETWNLAALTVAARNDHYTEFGAASTYQGGLELRPARSLLLRASAASSFKPPTLLQTAVDDLSLQLGTLNLLDPARGNEPIVSGELLRSTNHDLKPEKGRAFALGALWEPGASGTRLGLTAWRVKIDGLIALLTPQLVLNNESLFGAFVNRAPASGGQPGVVTRLVWAEVNFGRVQTGGVDIEAAHSWQSDTGRFTVGASVTRATQYDVAIAPGAPVDQRLGKRFVDYWAPKWKGRLSAGLDEGRWSLGLTSRYLGAYQDAGTSQRRLGDSWVHDLTGRVNLNRLGMNLGPVKSATVALSIVNLTDRQPQFADASPFFDSSQADWRGRYFSLRFAMDW